MNDLITTVTSLIEIEGEDWESLFIKSTEYIEILCRSEPSEIKEMIFYVQEHYYMECPFWVKLVAFKMLILQFPDNNEIRNLARQDVEMFGGPFWEAEIQKW